MDTRQYREVVDTLTAEYGLEVHEDPYKLIGRQVGKWGEFNLAHARESLDMAHRIAPTLGFGQFAAFVPDTRVILDIKNPLWTPDEGAAAFIHEVGHTEQWSGMSERSRDSHMMMRGLSQLFVWARDEVYNFEAYAWTKAHAIAEAHDWEWTERMAYHERRALGTYKNGA